MREHAEVGGKYVTVTNHTTYSFGIDDQEFIPAFECDEPADFMHLMMTLRETEASRWTERDTPIFVGALVEHPRRARRAGRRSASSVEAEAALDVAVLARARRARSAQTHGCRATRDEGTARGPFATDAQMTRR